MKYRGEKIEKLGQGFVYDGMAWPQLGLLHDYIDFKFDKKKAPAQEAGGFIGYLPSLKARKPIELVEYDGRGYTIEDLDRWMQELINQVRAWKNF